jgi:hypothetical protein
MYLLKRLNLQNSSSSMLEDGNYWLFVDYNTYKAADCELLLINNPLPAEMRKISIERIISYIIIHLYKSNL